MLVVTLTAAFLFCFYLLANQESSSLAKLNQHITYTLH